MRQRILTAILLSSLMCTNQALAQVTTYPYSEGYETLFTYGDSVSFLPNWWGNKVDSTHIFQDDTTVRTGTYALGIWPLCDEGEHGEEGELYIDVDLDLTGMSIVVASYWMATRTTNSPKHARLYVQLSTDGGTTFGPKIQMFDVHKGFANVNAPYKEFKFAFHPNAANNSNVVFRFSARPGAKKGIPPKMLIDDFYVYESAVDTFAPMVAEEPRPSSVSQLQIVFSEPVDATAENPANYSFVNAAPVVGSAVRSPSNDTVTLNLSTPIEKGIYYELALSNIQDLAGNVMANDTLELVYNPLTTGLVITEIMYDEPPVGMKDNLEFLELYNATAEPIPLGGLRIKGGISSGKLPEYTLQPGEYWVIAKDAAAFASFFGFTPAEWCGANLSNDEAEMIYIENTDHHSGIFIDSLTYTIGVPWPVGAAGLGHSMELCDPTLDNSDPANWRDAENFYGFYNGDSIWASPGEGCRCDPNNILLVDAGTNRTVYYGYPDSACTNLEVASASGGVPPYTYSWSNGEAGHSISVCPTSTTDYTVTITDAKGCTATDEVRVCVINVHCANNPNSQKVEVCHTTGKQMKSHCVSINAVPAYLSQGALLGNCDANRSCDDVASKWSGETEIITGVKLEAYPNPFTQEINILFTLEKDGLATLELLDVSGRKIAELFKNKAYAGHAYNITVRGDQLNAGLYFCRLQCEDGSSEIKKLLYTP